MRELGGYTLTHRLGVGGMGEVWKGTRVALGGTAVDVAIKVLSASKVDDPEARRMFLDEARLTMLLSNSNIVKVFDAAESDDKTCYMVMEWVDGLNLAELSAKVRQAGEILPDVIIAYIIGEVLKGLAHAHDLRHGGQHYTIVHRDVSPHNVMLSVSGEVKVMDFGIARMASEDTSGVHVKGKLRYMAPEQLRGETREPTLDLFAVGAMLHELLDGVKFRSRVIDEGRLYGMILDGEVPAMLRPADSLPRALDEVRAMLLAAKPEDRVQTAREAFRHLSRWPGYRDARFELDEIVRRFVALGQPNLALPANQFVEAPPAPAPRNPTISLSGVSLVTAVAPLPTAAGSFAGQAVNRPAEATATAVMRPDDSETDATRVFGSNGSGTVVAPRAPPPARDKRKIVAIALAVCGLGLGGVLVVNVLGGGDAPVIAAAEDDEPSDASAAVDEVEPSEARLDLGQAATPPADKVIAPTPEPEPAIEPEPEPDKPKKAAAAKTRVSIKLGGGVPWAEVKLGSRNFVLDAFASNSASTKLPAGSVTASFRTKVGGPWQKAGRIYIPAGKATITLQKSGELVIK